MRVVLVAGAALALAGAVLAAGPSPVAQQGSRGVVAPGGKIRYVTLARSGGTVVAARPVRGRRVLRSARLAGVWGIPTVTWNGDTAGVSADGRTLVLASAVGTAQLRKTTRFPVLDAQTLRLRKIVTLRGHYSFDALSPNGRMLYLIHNVSRTDLGRYTVVAYDLPFDRLTRRIVDDRRRSEWSMTGSPIARATAPDGGWAYTFYMGGEGKLPFVHALDTRHAKAVCIDIPWRGRREDLWKIRMTLRGGDLVVKLARKPIFVVDTKTYRVSRASP
jgi:hypothetical protein